MTQSTADLVSQMLETHYMKSKEGYYGGRPRANAIKLMEGGLLRDYLNEATPQGFVKEFDSALTWATPTNWKDRLLILNCVAAADILPDDEPDHLDWRDITMKDDVETVHLKKASEMGFGFSLVTIDRCIYVRRIQPLSPAHGCGKLREGDRVVSVCGKAAGGAEGVNQNYVIKLLKSEVEIDMTVSHCVFDGKGCPETTYDRSSPLLSPALESSYKLAMDLSHSNSSSTTLSNTPDTSWEDRGTSSLNHNGLSTTGCDNMIRGNVRADKGDNIRTGRIKYTSSGSMCDTTSTASSVDAIRSTSDSSGSESVTRASLSPRAYYRPDIRNNTASRTSSMSSHSSANKDFYRDSFESLASTSGHVMGSTDYIVLPNRGRGIGVGISGKCGVIIRNILAGSIADKDGRLQIGDHILQVNQLKCAYMGQKDTKEIVIPTLRNSTPTVRLVVRHVSTKLRSVSGGQAPPHTPKTGPGATLPSQKHVDQAPDLLLPEAMWSDTHPAAPIAYRFGTVVIPAPAWIRWDEEHHPVTLTRLCNGYGFSIMDYKEPKQQTQDPSSVLIIRQITPFGAADLEGHLALGERIMAVNNEPITTHTIEDIVALIKPCSVLQLTMCRPVETDPWRQLLNTNISSIPLVSGPKSTRSSCQGNLSSSTSTLNVQRICQESDRHTDRHTDTRGSDLDTSSGSGSYFRFPFVEHRQPIIRQPGDTRHGSGYNNTPGINTRYSGEYPDNQGYNKNNDQVKHPSSPPTKLSNRDTIKTYQSDGRSENLACKNQRSLSLKDSYNNDVEGNHRYTDHPRENNRRYTDHPRENDRRSYSDHLRENDRRSYSDHLRRLPKPLSVAPQLYETTFGTKNNASVSSGTGSSSDIKSINSSISLNNKELTDLWRQRTNQTTRPRVTGQLSHV